jgi:hypothetical protein
MTSVPEEDYTYRYGFLRTCIDQRFVTSTRAAFEKASGLRPAEYWHETYAGGAAVPPPNTRGEEYAASHGAANFGWQAHLNGCRGQPHVIDQEIIRRLDRVIAKKRKKFPHARHFRIVASEQGIDIQEMFD